MEKHLKYNSVIGQTTQYSEGMVLFNFKTKSEATVKFLGVLMDPLRAISKQASLVAS